MGPKNSPSSSSGTEFTDGHWNCGAGGLGLVPLSVHRADCASKLGPVSGKGRGLFSAVVWIAPGEAHLLMRASVRATRTEQSPD